jgi:hypothetical protein
MGLTSRRRPWPYSMRVKRESGEWVGLMLRADPNTGVLYGKKTVVGQAITPTEYGYGSYDPFKERPFVYGPLTGGMGERTQRTTTRYKYAIDADLSIGGQRRRGPAVTEVTPPSTGYVDGFAEGLHGTTNTLFAFTHQPGTFTRNTLRRTGDSASDWVVSETGIHVRQGVRFKPQDNTAGDYLYAGLSGGANLRYYDGAAWANAVLPANTRAEYVAKVGDELWIAGWGVVNGAHVSKADTDPRLAASWSAPIAVGDASSVVTGLVGLGGTLLVFKTDGIYTLNADGTDNDLTPEFKPLANWQGENTWDTDRLVDFNGTNPVSWNGGTYFNFAGRSYRVTLQGDAVVPEPIGLSLFYDNDTEVRGYQTAFAGDPFYGWYAYYDPIGNNAYLCKQGTWVNGGDEGPVFRDVTNGAVRKFAGRKITALHVSSIPGPNQRLYIGFGNGTIGWITLPRNTPDPAGDPNCTYSAEPGYVYWPDHHAGAEADAKHWRGFGAIGPHLDADDSVSVAYRYTDDDAWTDLGTDLTAPGVRVNTPGSVDSNVLLVRETLNGTTTTTPQVDAVVLFEQIRPALVLEYTCTARLARYQARRDGTVDRRPPEQTRAVLREIASGSGPVTAEFPDETNQDIDAVDYAEVTVPDERAYGKAWDVSLRLLEFRTNSPEGTWDAVDEFTWGDLAAYSWQQVPTI